MLFVKQPLKQRHAASFRGLTLIELLVVIVIVGFLAAALFPATTTGVPGKIGKARLEMVRLDQAIRAYNSDYHRWPVSTNTESSGLADFTYGTVRTKCSVLVTNGNAIEANNAEVMSILLDLTSFGNGTATPNYDHSLNQRHMVSLIANMAAQEGSGVGMDGVYRDPWGNPYIITIDLDSDGKCRDAFYSKAAVSASRNGTDGLLGLTRSTNTFVYDVFELNHPIMIWSLGPDGKADPNTKANQGVNKDNVLGWQ